VNTTSKKTVINIINSLDGYFSGVIFASFQDPSTIGIIGEYFDKERLVFDLKEMAHKPPFSSLFPSEKQFGKIEWEELEKEVKKEQKGVIQFFLERENKKFERVLLELLKAPAYREPIQSNSKKIIENFLAHKINCVEIEKKFVWDFSDIIVHKQENIYSVYYYFGRKNYTHLRLGLEMSFKQLNTQWEEFLEGAFNERFTKHWSFLFHKDAWVKTPKDKLTETLKKQKVNLVENGKSLIESLLFENINSVYTETDAGKNDRNSEMLSEYSKTVLNLLESSPKKTGASKYAPLEFEFILDSVCRLLPSLGKKDISEEKDPYFEKEREQIRYIEGKLVEMVARKIREKRMPVTEMEVELFEKLEKEDLLKNPKGTKKPKKRYRNSTSNDRRKAIENYVARCADEEIKTKLKAIIRKMYNIAERSGTSHDNEGKKISDERAMERVAYTDSKSAAEYAANDVSMVFAEYFDKEYETEWLNYMDGIAESLAINIIYNKITGMSQHYIDILWEEYCKISLIDKERKELKKHFKGRLRRIAKKLEALQTNKTREA